MTRGPKRRMAIWTALALVAGVLALSTGQLGAGDGSTSEEGVVGVEVDLGGEPNDCDAAVINSDNDYELRVENPKDDVEYPVPGAEGVSVTLTVRNDKELDFVVTGNAVVVDVIVKGGQKSTHYDYDDGPGAVTEDDRLSAPTKGKGGNPFSISHTSFCVIDAVSVSGTVFVDTNQDGIRDPGEGPDVPRVITAYSGTTSVAVASASSATDDGSYTLYLTPGETYTVCEEAIPDFLQTAPDNTLCEGLGESGGYSVAAAVSGRDFGNAEEICGQTLSKFDDNFVVGFELFEDGNSVTGCDNKIGQLFLSGEGEGDVPQVNLPIIGPADGQVAGIGIIKKDFDSTALFPPLTYSRTSTGTYVVLPWCGLRDKDSENGDGDQFDPYLNDDTMYPSLDGVTDAGRVSVSCKVYVDENAEGIQTTVVLIQDDPFWR